ncbi:MAG: hypothetical protein R3E31_28570 [Chloroflexota bacterium]|nr:hypothetical protein [Anaerolineales bacterium]MCB8966838.1 hypothetical protein [Ardenticatenaceae bacterium]
MGATISIILLLSVIGIVFCVNPFRRTPDYGTRSRASIRNVRSYERYN